MTLKLTQCYISNIFQFREKKKNNLGGIHSKGETELQSRVETRAKTTYKRVTSSGLEENFKGVRSSLHNKADIRR